jgi:DNA-binding winged helix-turn-helix (wHTH) protein
MPFPLPGLASAPQPGFERVMDRGRFRFDAFELDSAQRRLLRDGVPVELNARYLDALVLLVAEAGALVTKDRFMDEVWRGVPVTDEALTQGIRTLRRQLGDDAANPRFIETVPKHGYRFVAAVEVVEGGTSSPALSASPQPAPAHWLLLAGMGVIGAGLAGVIGGLVYGSAAAAHPAEAGAGGVSVLLVLTMLTLAAALMGGAGVSVGIAAARRWRGGRAWLILGGALGGLLVGGIVKLLGVDAFNLLLGRAPAAITGGYEGLLLGAGVGCGAWLAGVGGTAPRLRLGVTCAALTGGTAGLAIALSGGRLMGGSIDLLAQHFPSSRLRIDRLGALVGEDGFGPVAAALTATLEGALFSACIVGAMVLTRAERRRSR